MAARGKLRLSWLLLLVAVTAVLPTNDVYNGNNYRSIIENAIKKYPELAEFPKTPDHPKGKQFAMMIAIPQQDYVTGNTDIQLDPPPTWQKEHNPVEPSVIGNYLVARPDTQNEALQHGGGRQHAEIKVLNRLNELLTNFEQKYGRPPALVLLYTWYTPCPDCTNYILQTKNSFQSFHLAVLYSDNKQMPGIGMTYDSNEKNRLKLRNAGIPVFKVDLPSIGGQGGSGNGGGFSSGGHGGGQLQLYLPMNTLPFQYNPSRNTLPVPYKPFRNTLPVPYKPFRNTLPVPYNPPMNTLPVPYNPPMNTLPVPYNPSFNLLQNRMRQTLGGYGSTRRFPMNTVRPTLRPNTNNWSKMLKRFPIRRG